MVNTSDSGSRSRGFEPHSGSHVVSLSKTYLPPPPQSTGNTGSTGNDKIYNQESRNLFLKSLFILKRVTLSLSRSHIVIKRTSSSP